MSEFGLYVHIPFCSFLCHYCDFAKTARWDHATTQRYFASLERQLAGWLKRLPTVRFTSLNFGGGTPSLFTSEYEPLLSMLAPYLAPGAEVSLEANPADISRERLQAWTKLGVNRLSLGVQTFQEAGLKFLKRDHDALRARAAIDEALAAFANVNVDLIYSWPGQDVVAWQADLRELIDRQVPHLSLYNLCYAPQTPIGRAHERGLVVEASEDLQAGFYEEARKFLATNGYEHDEISNWSRPGYTCRHNWLYWEAKPYLGVGAGACGFLPDDGIGVRYAYTRHLKQFAELGELSWPPASDDKALSVEARDHDAWLTEYVGCGLRCRHGIDLARIRAVTGRSFVPEKNRLIADALGQGTLNKQEERLTLVPEEWFRETAWSLELLTCFG